MTILIKKTSRYVSLQSLRLGTSEVVTSSSGPRFAGHCWKGG